MSESLDNWKKLQGASGDLIDQFAAFTANERELEDSRHPASDSRTEMKSSTRQRHTSDPEPRR
jgi:hypothetical protein